MKSLKIFSIAVMAMILCAGITACNNESDNIIEQEEKKMCTVNFNVKSIVKVEEQPMARTEGGNDLYLIAIANGTNWDDVYAYGLFDNLNNISIQLVEGNTYSIQALAVKNAKHMISSTNNRYYSPFIAQLTNSFVYEEDDNFESDWRFYPIAYRLNGLDSEIAIIAPYLEVFYGYTNNGTFVAEENSDPIAISFGRFAACSAEFKVIDMPTGYLKISISNKETSTQGVYTTKYIAVNSESEPTFLYITFGQSLFPLINNDGVPCILNLTWVKDANTEIPLIPAEFTFKKNTHYNITIKVDNSTKSTINVSPITDNGFTTTEDFGINGQPISNN